MICVFSFLFYSELLQENGIIPLERMEKMYAGKLGWLLTVFHKLRKSVLICTLPIFEIVVEVIEFC